jgi:hypothetical protein
MLSVACLAMPTLSTIPALIFKKAGAWDDNFVYLTSPAPALLLPFTLENYLLPFKASVN